MKKKAQASVPFQWIFILIAGTIILIFFVNIVMKQKDISEKKISMQILNDLGPIIAGAGASQFDTVNEIDIPKTSISFVCDKTGYSEYSITGTGMHEDTSTEIIVSPNEIKGKKMITWTLPWDMPFKADNFLILTSDDVKYIFVYDNELEPLKERIEAELPKQEHINYIFVKTNELADIEDYQNYKIRFVFVGSLNPESAQLPEFVKKMPDYDVSAVKISEGKIQYYRKKGNSLTAEGGDVQLYSSEFSIKDPALYSAIFAEDAEYYECVLRKAFRRLSFVAELYSGKIKELKNGYTGNCQYFYTADDANKIHLDAYKCSKNLKDCNFGELTSAATSLDAMNDNTRKVEVCAWVY